MTATAVPARTGMGRRELLALCAMCMALSAFGVSCIVRVIWASWGALV